ncbi:MAG: NAD(P)/FAD-dependent oxidoreductase [Clostridiales bacterium]|nr:NAD(P)/FAD-dependent oxidoreductase [Candidatus Crickella equi]
MKKVIVVGAGLVGCFCARALSKYDIDITVLESNGDVCTGISKAGSGIVYVGYDSMPGTLKSRLCIDSCKDFAELCEILDVRYKKCGSLMVSYGKRADERLSKKLDHGRIGGIAGLRMIDREEATAMEPYLNPNISTALFSEETGTVNPWELCIAAYECAANNGVEFKFNESVCGIVREDEGFKVETNKDSYSADIVVNCAGIDSDKVRELCEKPQIRIVPTAADYLITDNSLSGYVNHIIFHEPEEKSKGLTIVPTVDGNLLIGATERQASAISTATAESGIGILKNLCSEIMPELPLNKIIRSYGCMRPNPYYVDEEGRLLEEKKSISELMLLEDNGLFSFIGVKTPGMTMAPELGRYLTEKVLGVLGDIRERSDFKPYRQGITRFKDLSDEERTSFVMKHPDYGKIICRCEQVSEGEIREAIRRGARTVEAVKRRTSAGMGRCQGSYCRQQIIKMLEEADERI